jgi:hypothetical protein
MKVKEEEKKTCIDCFHCKTAIFSISKLTDEKCTLCYCAGKRKKIIHQDVYFLKKKVCQNFFDAKGA